MRKALFFLILLCLPSSALAQHNVNAGDGAIIIIGDQNSLNQALKSASSEKRMPGSSAIVSRNFSSEKNAVFLGSLDQQGFQIINYMKSSDDFHYYKFHLDEMGSVYVEPSRHANSFNYGIMEVGGAVVVERYTGSGRAIEQFFPPGDYVVFAKKGNNPTPYQISIKLKSL
ncbi:hypothetical protein [Agrobacterium vitis]|uniref:hypothetical protein n=1 Tax=Agrobacterium vitis TaxID=373 RepID=UPI003D2C4CAA